VAFEKIQKFLKRKNPMTNSQEIITNQIDNFKKMEQEYLKEIDSLQVALSTTQEKLYSLQQKLLHIQEIYRIASLQFPRLRREPRGTLTEADKAELEKWIGRSKSSDGLISIVSALEELQKYFPEDIRSNLYALVQKIIIGGSYGSGKTHRRV
jgi:hypothetical protein